MKKNLIFLLLILLCCSCVHLQDRNGKKRLIPNLRKDANNKLTKEQKSYILPFEFPSFSKDSNIIFRHIFPKNVQEINAQKKHTLWVVYYPCGSTANELATLMNFGKKIEEKYSKDFQTVWVSLTYDLGFVQEMYNAIKTTKNAYIASSEAFGDKLLCKHINFNKEIHTDLYTKYKDDLGDFYIFLVDNEKNLIFEGDFVWNEKEKESELKDKDIFFKFFKENYPMK